MLCASLISLLLSIYTDPGSLGLLIFGMMIQTYRMLMCILLMWQSKKLAKIMTINWEESGSYTLLNCI